MRLNPLTVRKLRRFRALKRGYYSFWLLVVLTALSLVAELLVNDKAIAVRYDGNWSFPTYAAVKLGAEFALAGEIPRPAGALRRARRRQPGDHAAGAFRALREQRL